MQELVDAVGGDGRARSDQPVTGGVHRVPVVHRRLLHLVAGDEGDVLLPAGPGPARGGLVGLAQHLDQPAAPAMNASTSPSSSARGGRRLSSGGAGSCSATIVRPEPVHLGEVPDQVGHRPVGAVLDPGVEVAAGGVGEARAVLGDRGDAVERREPHARNLPTTTDGGTWSSVVSRRRRRASGRSRRTPASGPARGTASRRAARPRRGPA